MPELESELQSCSTSSALYKLVMRYVHAVDRNDKEMLLACFHPDGFSATTPTRVRRSTSPSRSGRRPSAARARSARGSRSHQRAVRSARRRRLRRELPRGHPGPESARPGEATDSPARAPGIPIERMAGDRPFERRDGEWRIVSRRVAMEWLPEEMDESPLGPGRHKLADFAPTRYDDSDRSCGGTGVTMSESKGTAAENKERERLFVEVLQDRGEIGRVEECVRPEFVEPHGRPGSPAEAEGFGGPRRLPGRLPRSRREACTWSPRTISSRRTRCSPERARATSSACHGPGSAPRSGSWTWSATRDGRIAEH